MAFRKILSCVFVLSSLVFAQSGAAQTESPATIPSSIAGTYNLTYSESNSGGPFADGASITAIITTAGALCLNDASYSEPVLFNGNPAEAIWKDTANGFNYAVSNLETGFNEINVNESEGAFLGQLTGSKTSESGDCSASATPVVTDAMNSVFDLAESKLSDFFPAGGVTLFFENYVYRFYETTGIYLAFAGDSVFLLGGAFGEAVVEAGSISSVLSALEAYEATNPGTGSDSGSLWNLTISGTVTTTALGVPATVAFAGISVTNVPAPDLSNTAEIDQEIISSLDGIATGISSIAITVVNDTANQRTFNVTFSATAPAPGVTISYQLTYDYTQ